LKTTFQYSLRRHRLAMWGWGIGLGIIAAVVVIIYDSVADKFALIDEIMKNMPAVFTAFAGDAQMLSTPSGWLHMKYFVSLPVIFGPFAVLAGAGLLAADEERGRLDLLMAYPTARWQIFFGRLAALFTATGVILFAAWLGLIAGLPFSNLEVTPGAAFLPFISLFGMMVLFESFALFLCFILGSRILAAGAAGVVLIADFFIDALVMINPALETTARCLPYHYYQGGMAADGFQLPPFLALVGVAAVMIGLACWAFHRRDIRVMGEGSFRWPWRWRLPGGDT
jgi:ABC-2 type transport system permease protein